MGEFLSTSPSLSIETNDKNHTEASGFRRPSRWHVERVVIGHYSVSYLAVILHSPSHFYINCTFMKETITFSSLTLLHLFLKIRYSNHRLPMQIWTEKFVVSWCVVLSCYEKVTNYKGSSQRFSLNTNPSIQLLSPVSLRAHELQHARLPCPWPTLRACSNSCPLSWWWHPAISSSVVTFSSSLQSFTASGSFLMSQLFVSCGQSIGASASASGQSFQWIFKTDFLSRLTGLISSQSKGISRVFSKTTVQKHQYFSAQLSL